MTNIFKPNSRFSALLDDSNDFKKEKEKEKKLNKKEQSNSIKSSERKDSRFKPCDEKEIEQYKLHGEAGNSKKEFQEKGKGKGKDKEKLHLDPLNTNDFPELVSSVKKEINEERHIRYIDMLKKEEEMKHSFDDPDLVNLEPGWLLIKKERQTGNTIMKYGPGSVFYEEIKEPEKTENELVLDVVDALIELHEKRTDEYIELNGYDVWEKMFKYPNWQEREAYLYEEEDETSVEDDEYDQDENFYDYDEYDDYYYD
jgi:hypothetical protein